MHVARPLTCTRATRQPQRARHTAVRAVHASEGGTLLRQPLLRATLALGRVAAAAALAASVLTAAPVLAKENQVVGEFNASGMVFKDSVQIISFADPKVEGVTLYISDFKRSLSAKMQKDFFSEPSSASITCVQSGPLMPTVDLDTLKAEGEEVYKERKNLSLSSKTLRVRRLYDKENQVLVYVAYSTRLSGSSDDGGVSAGRYKTSLCAVPLASLTAPTLAELAV